MKFGNWNIRMIFTSIGKVISINILFYLAPVATNMEKVVVPYILVHLSISFWGYFDVWINYFIWKKLFSYLNPSFRFVQGQLSKELQFLVDPKPRFPGSGDDSLLVRQPRHGVGEPWVQTDPKLTTTISESQPQRVSMHACGLWWHVCMQASVLMVHPCCWCMRLSDITREAERSPTVAATTSRTPTWTGGLGGECTRTGGLGGECTRTGGLGGECTCAGIMGLSSLTDWRHLPLAGGGGRSAACPTRPAICWPGGHCPTRHIGPIYFRLTTSLWHDISLEPRYCERRYF